MLMTVLCLSVSLLLTATLNLYSPEGAAVAHDATTYCCRLDLSGRYSCLS